ncbi:MAG: metallophosphoesterase [Clostridium sp.]|jgi:predicted phosphodiesterase|nr:metallophosphoesterase [Clostridium sp.]
MKASQKPSRFFHSRVSTFVFYSLAAFAVAAFYAVVSSGSFAWITTTYQIPVESFALILGSVSAACALAQLVFFCLQKKLKECKICRALHVVVDVLCGVLAGYTLFLIFGLDKGIDMNNLKNGASFMRPTLLFLALAIGLVFLFVFFLSFKRRGQTICAVILSIAILVPVVYNYLPIELKQPFDASAQPLVLDIGGDNYSVIFATNRSSTAYLTYTKNGTETTIADSFLGTMNTGRVHHFIVPREELNGASYFVTAREISLAKDANTTFGKTYNSPGYSFKGEYKDELNILVISDWHDHPAEMLEGVEYLREQAEPDLFLMMGDFASNYNSEDEFILNTITAGADATKSEIPAIYVRGNHELFGGMTDIIFPNLGLDNWYYQVQRGKYLFTVCDGGDDWDTKRSSLNSELNAYRDAEMEWLESLKAPEEGTFHFAACHIPNFNNQGDSSAEAYFAQLERLQVDMQFSGHEHNLHLDLPGTGAYKPPFPLFVDGGPQDEGSYSPPLDVSMARVSADGTVQILSYDNNGNERLNETLKIK